MALPKITDTQIQESGVQSLPDKLTGNAAENKKKFDQLVQNVVKKQYNALIEALEATGGAAEIGANVNGIEAGTIQGVLSALKTLIDDNKTSQDNTNSSVQTGLDNVYTKGQTDAKVKAVQDDVDANESAQNAVNSGVQTALNNRYTKDQTDSKLGLKLDTVTGNELVKSISFNSDNGVFTITTLGGKTTTIDTMIEKLPVSFSIVGNKLRITADDGTYQEADLSAFVDTYTFKDTDTIDFSQSGKEISAIVKAGSIGKTHLQAEVMEDIHSYAIRAEEAAEAAAIDQVGAAVALEAVLLHKEKVAEDAAAATTAMQNARNAESNANTYAKSAQGASSDALTYANEANSSKNAAAKSASDAAKSAESAAADAARMEGEADRAVDAATRAESWAVGGTGLLDRGDEDYNNAMYYATKSKRYAVGGTNTEGGENTTNAKYYSERAGMWAMGPSSETNDPGQTHNASYYCAMAQSAQKSAKGYAEAAAESASQCADAVEKAAEAEESAQKSRVWAVGYEQDYTAPGDKNNAKYWAGVAKENANAKQGNWAQGDPNKPDYIFNRTHYTDVISEGGTILAEKNLTFGAIANFMLLSGDFSSIRAGGKYKVIWNGSAYTRVAYEYKGDITIGNASLIGTGGENTGEPFCLSEMTTSGCTCYKETTGAGTVTVAVEGVKEEVVKQLDPKYIKDMYYTEYGEELLEDTEATYVGGNQFKLTKRLGLVAGKEYMVTVNGVEYVATAKAYKGSFVAGVAIGNAALGGESGAADTGESYLIVDLNESSADGFGYGVAIWFGDGSVSVTVGVATNGQVHQIPAKYIPGGAGGGSGADLLDENGKIAKQYLPDDIGGSGADLLNEDGIIKQQVLPEGFPYEGKIYTPVFPEVTADVKYNDYEAFGGIEDIPGEEYFFNRFKKYQVVWNGVEYECTYEERQGGGYNGFIGRTSDDDTAYPFKILDTQVWGNGYCNIEVWVYDGSSSVTFSINLIEETFRTIDPKFLPEDLPSAKEGYLLPETVVEGGSMDIPDLIPLVDGSVYTVNWNGTKYTCIAHSFDYEGFAAFTLGNAESMGGVGNNEPFCIVAFAMVSFETGANISWFDDSSSAVVSVYGEVVTPIGYNLLPEGYAKYKIGEVMAETDLEFTDGGGIQMAMIPTEFELEMGRTYLINWGGETYECKAVAAEGVAVGNIGLLMGGENTGEPFIIMSTGKENAADFGSYGMALNLVATEPCTVTVTILGEVLSPMDNSLLPKDIEANSFILPSSTDGSTKRFKITVDDSGTLTATEITE